MAVINQTLSPSETIYFPDKRPSYFSALFIPLGFLVLGGIIYCLFSQKDFDLPGSNYIRPATKASERPAAQEMVEM